MRSNSNRLQKITTTAVFIALTCVLTMAVRIPSPTKGYLNLGDCAVLLGGFLLGPVYGTIAGGFGSALADFLAGYPIYIPGTLIIKAMMALIISLVPLFFAKSKNNFFRIGFIIFSILAELLMVAGYYLYEAVIIGEGFVAAFAGVSGNIVQGIVGIVGSYFLVELLSRTEIFTMCGSNGFVKGQKK